MTPDDFRALISPITDAAADKPVDGNLADHLNAQFPPTGETFKAVEAACHEAMADGWMCAEGAPGRRFGRVIKPGPATGNLSVDVVDLEDIVGPHHRHPTGEICMVMPQNDGAEFGGFGAGWCVFGAGSAHKPTVAGGRALVLYMLPGGEIEFTK